MLQITKQGNSIVVEGLNHYFYPYNGTLEVPCNSVITVVDEGDIVLFRSASNYDVLFSAKVDEITINGQSVTKDNVGEVFGALSNVSSGGGSLTPEQEEKLNNAVQISDYNADKATQTTIDEAQNTEINKVKGDIAGKQDIIQDLNAIREGADLGKTALQEETDPVWTAEKVNYYTKSEVNTSLESKADKTEIPTVPTNVSAFTNDAGYLTEHQSLDNYYTKSEVDTSLEAKANKTEIPTVPTNVSAFTNDAGYLTEHQSLDNYYTKSQIDTSLESKANKTEIPTVPTNVSAFTNDAGYLTEHQSLDNYYTKTESDGKYATQVVVNEEIAARISDIRDVKAAIETKADKSEIPTVPTNVSAFTNDAGYLTEHQSLNDYYTKTEVNTSLESKADKSEIPSLNGYATEQWVGEQGYLTEHQSLKTINGETIVGNGNIEISSGEETDPVWTAEKVNYYTKTEVNTSLESKADKTEIPTVPTNVSAFTNDAGYLTEHQPLKTINGETIVGDGDIIQLEISHGLSKYSGLRVINVNCSDRKLVLPSFNMFNFYKKDGTIVSKFLDYDKAFGGYKLYDADFDDFMIYWGFIDIGKGSLSFSYYINPSPFADMIQPKLTSGTDIKTINGESILGSGDIVISGGGEETDPVWTAEKVNYYTKSEVDTSLESKANKTEIPSLDNYYTKSEIDGIVGNVNNALSEIING